jgi:hypothetical protein
MQIELYSSPWRSSFERFLKGVHTDLLIATPFIKKSEANWVCSFVAGRSIHLSVLTDVRSDSFLNGSLDMDALKIFSHAADSKVIALPGLHAKVYVRDKDFAIITSANLTPSGLQSNYEYGVGLSDPQIVYQIREDLEAYGRVGSPMTQELISELVTVSEDLIEEYNEVQRSARASIRKRFNQKLRKARIEFLRAQVGDRSAHALFSDAILYVLSKGSLKTTELHPRIQQLLPELCDDSVELIINGQRFGKRWKHAVRNAQQFLKRQGIIGFDGSRWSLIQ